MSLERLLSRPTLDLAVTELESRTEPLLGIEQRFGVGFMLQVPSKPLGPPLDAFGHDGAGGSVHGAWPSHGLGYSYAMNRMRDDCDRDPRAAALLEALAACAEAPPMVAGPDPAMVWEMNL
jgi:CubicO group peptidase (beta-lactamase class C family)